MGHSCSLLDRIRQCLNTLHPDHFRIIRAAFWVGLFSISAKVIAAGKEIAVAWRYGRGAEVDAYNLALTLSTWLPVMFISVVTVVLVPVLSSLRGADQIQRSQFLTELNGLGWRGAMVAMLLVGLFGIWGLSWYARGLDSTTLAMVREMMFSFIPLSAMTIFVGVNTVRLQAGHDHRYALANGLPPLAIIVLLWAWQAADTFPLLAGTLLGTALQLLWLARLVRSHDGVMGVSWRLQSQEWPLLWRSAVITGVGQFAMSFTTPIDQYFAASLETGAIATLGYANRLISLGMALGATIIARATLPVFSEAIAAGQHNRVRGMASRWAGLLLLIGIAAASLLWLIAPWMVGKIFQRGAFTSQDTLQVAGVFRYALLQLPFYFPLAVFASYLASTKSYKFNALLSLFFISVKLIITSLLLQYLGINGIALSNAVAYAASLLIFATVYRTEKLI